jgi:toxin YoeB
MRIRWEADAWTEYVGWQSDKAGLRRINALIKEIQRHPFEGIGKPEPLRGDLSGYWSRRIDDKNRLVYHVENDEITIAQCGGHYDPHR